MVSRQARRHILPIISLLVLSALTASVTLVTFEEIIANPIPLPDANRIVSLVGVGPMKGLDWPRGWSTSALSEIGVFQTVKLSVGNVAGKQETLLACIADAGFFRVLSVGPQVGRLFKDEDSQVGALPVAVVSNSFWKSHFGGSEDLSSARFFAAGRWIRVVGVLPPKVDFPAHAAIYLPHPKSHVFVGASNSQHWSADDISRGNDLVIARLQPGMTVAQAGGMEEALLERMRAANTDPQQGFGRVGVKLLRDTMTFRVKGQLSTITAAGLFVAAVALFSLFLLSAARAAELKKDIAVRIALGASRIRLLQQEVIWCLWVGTSASVAVVALTGAALRSARQLERLNIPRLGDLSLSVSQSLWIVAGTMAIALLLAIPYFAACRRVEPIAPILNRGESSSRLAVKPTVAKFVSVAQLSFALALTALTVRVCVNYWQLVTTAPGIKPSRVFISDSIPVSALNLGNQPALPDESEEAQDYKGNRQSSKIATGSNKAGDTVSEAAAGRGLFDSGVQHESGEELALRSYIEKQEAVRAAEEASRQPGVSNVALIEPVPYQPTAGSGQFIEVNGKESKLALPLFFVRGNVPATLGMRVLAGRWFDAEDEKNGVSRIIIGDALSKQYFNGHSIGKQMIVEGVGQPLPRTIIGVVDDVVPNYGEGIGPAMYIPLSQSAGGASLVVKMAPGVKRAPFPVRNESGDLLQFQPWTSMTKMMSDAGSTDRASAIVAGWFAMLVLLLSAASAYAVFWMVTIQRQRELAIRVCFGALPVKVALGLVLNGLVLACCAGIGGFAIQQTLQRVLSWRIYQFPAFSWPTFLISFGVITAATLLSVARPAASILRISPAELLRDN